MATIGKKSTMNKKNWSKDEETVFWKPGFQILQNIDDQLTLSSGVRQVCDQVTLKKTLANTNLPVDDAKYDPHEDRNTFDTEHASNFWR